MTAQAKQENVFLNLLLNIIVPTVILTKFSGDEHLGTRLAIVVALAFPICYGVYDFFRVKKVNFFSGLGVVSILLTGGISLLELDPKYIAIKEAAIPGLLGLATLISLKTRYPVVRTFLFNEKLIQVSKVESVLQERDNSKAFSSALTRATCMIAGSFFLSSILNYVLARIIMVSPAGTEAFNQELGKMTFWSYPVIAVPTMLVMFATLFYLYKKITGLTGLPLEQIFHDPEQQKKGRQTAQKNAES